MKCAYLLNLSITTKMTSLPSDLGSPFMKSMLMSMNGACGMGSGCSNPSVRVFSDLFN
jgi:hypothetical protein